MIGQGTNSVAICTVRHALPVILSAPDIYITCGAVFQPLFNGAAGFDALVSQVVFFKGQAGMKAVFCTQQNVMATYRRKISINVFFKNGA